MSRFRYQSAWSVGDGGTFQTSIPGKCRRGARDITWLKSASGNSSELRCRLCLNVSPIDPFYIVLGLNSNVLRESALACPLGTLPGNVRAATPAKHASLSKNKSEPFLTPDLFEPSLRLPCCQAMLLSLTGATTRAAGVGRAAINDAETVRLYTDSLSLADIRTRVLLF
ncbi:hypothetical protein LZ30DRAFT_243186 [Colletotrichum cereale]|nr:hypothetical protein LZ30DRAFT_243186 [Colletotrichum cereale]